MKGLTAKLVAATGFRFLPGVYMGWGLGANDAANVFGTAVTTRVIRYRDAVVLTAIFVVIGAWSQGPMVMGLFTQLTKIDATEAMLAALAAAVAMHAMTYWGVPSSSSQAIVGSVIGIGLLDGSANLNPLVKVVVCWIAAPIGAAFFSLILFAVGRVLVNRYVQNIMLFETFIRWFIIAAGCYGAYSLGANNVGNVTGVYYASGLLTAEEAALLGGFGIALGALTYSKNVMMTVGAKITTLHPFSAAIATLAAALAVHVFVYVGVPVSTSQAAVGAVTGIGLLKGTKTLSTTTLTQCLVGWLLTPLSSGIVAVALVWGWRALGR